METLFKEYIFKQLQRYQWDKAIRFKSKGPKKYLARDIQGSRDYVLLQPELYVLGKDGSLLSLVNIKWESMPSGKRQVSLPEQDVSQLVSCALRFGLEKVYLVYPARAGFGADNFSVKVEKIAIEVVVLYVDIVTEVVDWSCFAELEM